MPEVNLIIIIISLCSLLVAVIGHEIMHALVALYYGDNTAKLAGRISINPIKHIDLFGSIVLPIMLFLIQSPFMLGWAKPVPINMKEVIKNGGYNGAIMVSLAGIIYNFLLAIFASVILQSGFISQSGFGDIVFNFLLSLIVTNTILAFFNLLPIPPLDGSQALAYLSLKFNNNKIPYFFNKIEKYGIFIVMIILLFPPLSKLLFIPIDFFIKIIL